MNNLAHAYLSFGNDDILVGNIISDFVHGKEIENYPEKVQQGIRLHRLIDEFTDFHEVNKEAREIFRADYRLYSGAMLDVVYDHFLATDSDSFTQSSLMDFSQQVYGVIEKQKQLPERFAGMFPYMQQQNWLYDQYTVEGVVRSVRRLVRRAKYMDDSRAAENILRERYNELDGYFHLFWKDLKSFAWKKYNELLSL
ncbi:MAG: ACP phosphodiesterase [Niabella sp.]